MKLNRYLKYFLVFFIFLFSNFIAPSANSNEVDKIDKILITANNEESSFISSYPESLTNNVSKKLDSIFNRINKRFDFNGNVLVAKNGKLIYTNSFGFDNFNKKTKLNKNSSFQLASVSKQFTAVSIMILFEKGLLKLEDKVIDYFPNFPYEEISIQQLLHHTSGLPKYFWLAEHKWHKNKAPDNTDMMEMIAQYKLPLYFKSGAKFDYSNTGYFVLASLVEKISGMDYKTFVDTHIFKPLGMNNSFVYRYGLDSIQGNQLMGYRLYRGWKHVKISETVNDAIVGDKNVYATTEDLFKWIVGLNSGKIISKSSLDKMYTKGKTKYGREIPYGFGFRIVDENEEKVIYHNGKWNGFSTSIKQYKEDDLLVITLEHSSYRSMNYLNNKIKTVVDKNFNLPIE